MAPDLPSTRARGLSTPSTYRPRSDAETQTQTKLRPTPIPGRLGAPMYSANPAALEHRQSSTPRRRPSLIIRGQARPNYYSYKDAPKLSPILEDEVYRPLPSGQCRPLLCHHPQGNRETPPVCVLTITPSIMAEILNILDDALCGIPYAVCGLAALCVYGYTARLPNEIYISCLALSAPLVWNIATAAGMNPRTDGDMYTLEIKPIDGFARLVKVGFRPSPTDAQDLAPSFRTVRTADVEWRYKGVMGQSISTRAMVLTLSEILDRLAGYWSSNSRIQQHEEVRRNFVHDITWILCRIIAGGFVGEGAQPLTPTVVPHVVDPSFWDDFLKWAPDTVHLFLQAGLGRWFEKTAARKMNGGEAAEKKTVISRIQLGHGGAWSKVRQAWNSWKDMLLPMD